ncbi:MAG: amino acid dehydrogenase [Alphaproteobacteria bacterium]|nr:amino acid dehydrogenase [Alphaproteobacteria bacterium]
MRLTALNPAYNPNFDQHERVVLVEDDVTGLKAIIAVHNSTLGPGMGGCRIYNYKTQEDAITDVLRLSRGMTYKSALAGLPLGGGKSVIIADSNAPNKADMMRAFGDAIEKLSGIYITAEDIGSTDEDMIEIARSTSYVCGLPPQDTVLAAGLGGNPSPLTAYGVFQALRALTESIKGTTDIKDVHFAVQGLGAVGSALVRYLRDAGAKLTVTDMVATRMENMPFATASTLDDIYNTDADIFCPCAMGAILNTNTIPHLRVKAVGGAANNQLATKEDDAHLKERGIRYAPDYVVNAGGIIAVAYEYFVRNNLQVFPYVLNKESLMAHIEKIRATTAEILAHATNENLPTGMVADKMAESIFAK